MAEPKYRLQAKTVADGQDEETVLPHTCTYCTKFKDDALVQGVGMAMNFPGDIIEIKLLRDFKHNRPLRWRYDRKLCKFVEWAWFDKLAAGKNTYGVPLDRKAGV